MTHASLRLLLLLWRNETWRWHLVNQSFQVPLVLTLTLLRSPFKDLLKSCFSQLSLLVLLILLHGLIKFLSSRYCCSHLFFHILLVLPSLIKQSLIEIKLQRFLDLIANTLVMVDSLLPVTLFFAALTTWKIDGARNRLQREWRPHNLLRL